MHRIFLFVAALSVLAWNRTPAIEFATLPYPLRHPEGLTVDRRTAEFYVADFDFQATSPGGRIAVFDQSGRLLRVLSLQSSPALLGLDFHPITHELLVLDFGAGAVLRVDPNTGAATTFAVPPDPAKTGLNALTFDKAGNVYVSDSFQGIIWKTGPAGGALTQWVQSALLLPNGVPPFGANGLAFNSAGTLFVANTATDQIIQIPVAAGVPGTPSVFVNSINGADGLIIDTDDNLWVAANQADEIVVVDPGGKGIAKLGDFEGIAPGGSPRGLLFPASPVFFGEFVYVTNLALDLRNFGLAPSPDSDYCAQVTAWNVARISRHLPPVHDRAKP